MAPPMRIMTHVGRTAEAGQPAERDGGGIRIRIHLQGRANEQVDSILTGQLAQHAVGAQAAVMPDEERRRPRTYVFLHADLAAEAVHALDPAALNGRDQRRMRIQRPVTADLALSPRLAPYVGSKQLDCRGIEADSVIEGGHLMVLVDATNDHHAHQHLQLGDLAWVAGKERLDSKRTV